VRRDPELSVVQESLDQVVLANRLGIDAAWAVEHHFLVERARRDRTRMLRCTGMHLGQTDPEDVPDAVGLFAGSGNGAVQDPGDGSDPHG
jgi:hypothetical protein